MKRAIYSIISAVIIALVAVFVSVAIVKSKMPDYSDPRYYSITGQVEDKIGTLTQVVDSLGEVWEFYDKENRYPIGAKISFLMDSMNTEKRNDDVIIIHNLLPN